MRKHLKKLHHSPYVVYVYFASLLVVMVGLLWWPSLHRTVLTHPEGMSERDIRDKKEIIIITEGIVGKWQSKDDEKYVREFTSHEVIEWYDGEEISRDPYMLFEGSEVPSFLVEHAEPYMVYLMIGTANNQPLMFSINKFDHQHLETYYLARGTMLRYMRI
jgi:hypothetical protein